MFDFPTSPTLDQVYGNYKWNGYAWAPQAAGGGGGAPSTLLLTAGAGLVGGGDLSADRLFDVGAGTGITVAADSVALTVPVAVVNGGTGATTAPTALTSLGAAPVVHGHVINDTSGLQTALDAKVAGPATAVTNRIATFNGTTGKLIQDSGTLISALQPAITSAALTKVDDANVTLTLGGAPSTALLQATSITAGWTGTLAIARGGTGTATGISTATQTALDLKAPLASPAFTGTPTGITKSHVGLGNVDNTSDANKPVSTATQTALNAKVAKAGDNMTGHLGLTYSDPTITLDKAIAATGVCQMYVNTAGVPRWLWRFNDAEAEGGGNAGGNIRLFRCNDAGGIIDAALYVERASGSWLLGGPLILPADPTAALHAANKQYVDTKLPLAGGAMTGVLYPANTSGTIAGATPATAGLEVRSNGGAGDAAFMAFHRQGVFAAHFGFDTDGFWKVGGWSYGANSYKIWHEGIINPVSKAGDTMTGQLVVNVSAAIPLVAHGFSPKGGAASINGAIAVGENASFQGVIQYDTSSGFGKLYIDNTQQQPAAEIIFRTYTSGAARETIKIGGSGDVTISSPASSAVALQVYGYVGSSHAINGTAKGTDASGVIGFATNATTYGNCGSHLSGTATYYSFYGNAGAFISAGTWATSDERLKTITRNVDPVAALSAVNALAVKEYTPSSPAAQSVLSGREDAGPDETLYGWVAQDVEQIIPIAVRDVGVPEYDTDMRAALGGSAVTVKAINDRYMLTTLWSAVQRLSQQNTEMLAEISALKAAT